MTTILSDRLLALLYVSKSSYGKNKTPIEIVTEALGELYSQNMPLKAMILHCLHACIEICNTKEFDSSSDVKTFNLITKLLTSSFDYYNDENNNKLFPNMDDVVSFQQINESYLVSMINFIIFTNISWSEQYKEYCKTKTLS
jgi:hypothetical protein